MNLHRIRLLPPRGGSCGSVWSQYRATRPRAVYLHDCARRLPGLCAFSMKLDLSAFLDGASRRPPWPGAWPSVGAQPNPRRGRPASAFRLAVSPGPTRRALFLGEAPRLLRKAVYLAGNHGASVPVLAQSVRITPAHSGDLLGETAGRPVRCLVGSG